MEEETGNESDSLATLERWKGRRRFFVLPLASVFLLVAFYVNAIAPPSAFPVDSIVAVPRGATLTQVARMLEERHLIRSPLWFEIFVWLRGGQRGIIANPYLFDEPVTSWTIARRLLRGELGLSQVRVTIPEGVTAVEIGELLKKNLPAFDLASFMKAVRDKEGYLFPDTYFFLPDETAEGAVKTLSLNFERKILSIQKERESFGKQLSDVVIVASLLEKEASKTEDRKIIAGILWKRLAIDMPLQVDAALLYINGGRVPTGADTKIDSPYNTYLYRGLPPTPIANPGLDAITVAVTPVKTEYFYYLSDDDGVIHYAKTFEEHQENQQKYFR